MVKQADATLVWSEARRSYIWYEHEQGGLFVSLNGSIQPLLVNAASGQAERTSFSFQGRQGHVTLLKERRARGAGYWYAYRRQGRRTVKRYAGRTHTLTIARLEELAQALNPQPPVQLSMQAWQPPAVAGQMPLLVSKLHPPRPHASLLRRERLLIWLEGSLDHKLTLLSAPAGSGKTTLLSTWIAAHADRPAPTIAWVTLESSENDPIRFWRYLIAACQQFQPDHGRDALALLHPTPQLLSNPFLQEALLIALLNELTGLPSHNVLVLEDYHLIVNPDVHQSMIFLLEHLPPTLHVIVLTRHDPPFPLAKLRAHGDLAELDVSLLSFTLSESREFLQQALPFPLDASVLARLQELTLGWAAGLHLMTLTFLSQGMQSVQEVERWLMAGSGEQRHLLEYLVGEVLVAQPPELQSFLLQTSGLSRLTGSLCAMATGRDDSSALLVEIERANLFLIPAEGDDSVLWYRYHPLWASVLQHEARRRLGEHRLRTVSSNASHWYERSGFLPDAIEASLLAVEMQRAADLIARYIAARHLLQIEEIYTILRWLRQLPEASLYASALLSRTYALFLSFGTKRRTPALKALVEKYLSLAENTLSTTERGALGEVLAIRALTAGQLNDTTTAIRAARQAIEMLPEQEIIWRSVAFGMLSMNAILTGRYTEAQQALQQTSTFAEAVGRERVNNYASRGSLVIESFLALGQGRLPRAEQLFHLILAQALEDQDYTDQIWALVGLAQISFEWNQLPEAERLAQKASLLSREHNDELFLRFSTIMLARILSALDRTPEAKELLRQLQAYLALPASYEATMWLASFAFEAGDFETVQHWITNVQALSEQDELSEVVRERAALLSVRLQLAEGSSQDVLAILARLRESARSQSRLRSELEILLLMANISCRQHYLSEAREYLREALLLARPAGYRRIFLEAGTEISNLLKDLLPALREPLLTSYIRTLLRPAPPITSDQPGSEPAFPVSPSEPLSTQELRVLRLLVAGHSNPEIARRLVVSPNTIKTQVSSIYSKLGVNNRLAASNLARQLRLV